MRGFKAVLLMSVLGFSGCTNDVAVAQAGVSVEAKKKAPLTQTPTALYELSLSPEDEEYQIIEEMFLEIVENEAPFLTIGLMLHAEKHENKIRWKLQQPEGFYPFTDATINRAVVSNFVEGLKKTNFFEIREGEKGTYHLASNDYILANEQKESDVSTGDIKRIEVPFLRLKSPATNSSRFLYSVDHDFMIESACKKVSFLVATEPASLHGATWEAATNLFGSSSDDMKNYMQLNACISYDGQSLNLINYRMTWVTSGFQHESTIRPKYTKMSFTPITQ